jgi:methylenetetrahydrofolate--tRNA-(uracil-5-)-methyltransferase
VAQRVVIVGGGLAGSEAALQLAHWGIPVDLWEQRLARAPSGGRTPAHETSQLAELVCSNSFKSTDPKRALGLLKEELSQLESFLIAAGMRHSLPGGAALVVDRERFSNEVTAAVQAQPLIELRAERFAGLRDALSTGGIVILATGPLTNGALWDELVGLAGDDGSYFFDATSPIVALDGVDRSVVFAQSRYDKGEGKDYLNCPLDEEEYRSFREALMRAEVYPLHAGEDYRLYEGCLPIEELAARGEDAMRFGPLKPRGLTDPRAGRMPYAAVQLRNEDALCNAASLVGFQTRLRQGEQERVFRMIPGLGSVRFLRFGRMHRNSYLNAPRVLKPTLQLAAEPRLIVAGQLTGLEGYVSAIATGLWAAVNAALLVRSDEPLVPPEGGCLGAMLRYMTNPAHRDYAPSAFQHGMLTWLPEKMRRAAKERLIRERAEQAWAGMRTVADRLGAG